MLYPYVSYDFRTSAFDCSYCRHLITSPGPSSLKARLCLVPVCALRAKPVFGCLLRVKHPIMKLEDRKEA